VALVTSDLLAALLTNQKVIFQKALGDAILANNDYAKISTRMPSDTDKETYNWLGATPNMNEWKDKRKLNGLRPYNYTLTNKHYEGSIEIERNTIEDEKYGMIKPRVQGLAISAIRHYNKLVFTQLDDGASLLAYDGIEFFDTVRVIGASANIANRLSGNYSDSEAEVRAGIAAGAVAMAGFQDDWGEVLGLMPDTIVCSPLMAMLIRTALSPGVSGVVRPEAELIKQIVANPWIDADTDDWYLLCTKEMVNPVIFQIRKEPEFVALDDPKSSHVFLNKTFIYGVDDRFAVGYGDPRTAVQLHNT